MNHVNNWIMGGVTALLAVGGLFVASNAGAGIAYYGGLLFFVFAVLLVFLFVRISYDH